MERGLKKCLKATTPDDFLNKTRWTLILSGTEHRNVILILAIFDFYITKLFPTFICAQSSFKIFFFFRGPPNMEMHVISVWKLIYLYKLSAIFYLIKKAKFCTKATLSPKNKNL